MFESIVVAMLIELHSADGNPVTINSHEVISMRGPRSEESHSSTGLFTKGANCLINTTDGKYVTVKETCKEVMRIFVDSEKVHEDLCSTCKEHDK